MTTQEKFTDVEFEELLSKYDYSFQKGDLVKGIVCSYDSEGVIVDIGAKTAAIVPAREARVNFDVSIEDTLVRNNQYEFLIVKEEDDDGRFTLSYKKVAMAYNWRELEDLKANDATVEGTVVSVVKGGILVEVKGVRGFVPSSHLRAKSIENIVGEKIELKILTMDAQQGNFILSNRKVYADDKEESKRDTFAQIEVGQIVPGEVVRITDFGAFIDIGGIDGLLPLSQISWRWVDHPSDILKIADKIKVEIIGVDHDKQRVSLSLKSLEQDPWIEAKDKINEGDKLEGVITRIKHFGAFVEVFPGVEALLPNNEIVDYQNKTGVMLKVGDKIETTILKFNPDDRRISLSIKSEG
ncbi:MAG: S1 RNA-binding domain-containing protein [Candidatus Gastranaerophilales bacterium]|nr:S1 RNA-binding domain-containing protein [Candidatus Gastranaerophilales bacterium]